MKRLYLFFIMCVFVQVSNSQQAVDLGLSVKWATCNVGASSPEDYGDYYAWGETETKSYYDWSTYKWCKGSEYTLTKYCTDSDYDTVDNKTVLEPEDDVAHVTWGGSWRMPTLAQCEELIDYCTTSWTSVNGVWGTKVVGPNGNSIFLPAAGCRWYDILNDAGSNGYYWSGTLRDGNDSGAYYLNAVGGLGWNYYSRGSGRSVRPVCQ